MYYSQFGLKQLPMEEKMENPSKKIKKIIDHRQTGESQIFYLVVREDGKEEWIQDVHLVGCDRLIDQFFSRQAEEQNIQNELLERDEEKPQEATQMKTRNKSKKGQQRQPRVAKVSEWSVPGVRKSKKKEKSVKKPKTPVHSKKYKETTLLQQKVRQLRYQLEERSPQQKLDYLLDYVEGVFLKNDLPYCVVKTMPPVRTYVVSLQDMQRYFVKTLKDYYQNVIKLHQRTLDDSSSIYSSYLEAEAESEEIENDNEINNEH